MRVEKVVQLQELRPVSSEVSMCQLAWHCTLPQSVNSGVVAGGHIGLSLRWHQDVECCWEIYLCLLQRVLSTTSMACNRHQPEPQQVSWLTGAKQIPVV